jgi:hypothetical protein
MAEVWVDGELMLSFRRTFLELSSTYVFLCALWLKSFGAL